MFAHLTRAARLALFWLLISAAVLISLARWLLADIGDYRGQLERQIRDTTGLPIRFGHLSAGMRGLNPEIVFGDINIDADRADAHTDIRLREIRAGIDFSELLLTWNWAAAGRITLVGADIAVLRQQDGSLALKGLQAGDEPPLWLLQGGRYEILDSRMTWQDLLHDSPPLPVEHIDLVFKNHHFDRSHELHLLARLPEQFGESVRISARFDDKAVESGSFTGEIYIEAVDLQANALTSAELPMDLHCYSGAGDLRVWSAWRDSAPYRIAGYLQAQQIKVGKKDSKPVVMDTLDGNFSWSHQNGRWRLAAYDLNIFANKQRWPHGEFYLQQNQQGDLSVSITQLDLPAAMLLAPLLTPAKPDYADWLKLNPRGRLNDVRVFVGSDGQQFAANGRFTGLGNDRHGELPGLSNLDGNIELTDRSGHLALSGSDITVDAANWFRQNLSVTSLHGRIAWRHDTDRWLIGSENLLLASPDFHTESTFQFSKFDEAGKAPHLRLRTSFADFADIGRVKTYLPAKIMDQDAVAWLDDAFVAGRVSRGELIVNGDLDRFPFADGNGRFETAFVIEHGDIQFNELWPHLQDVYADVQFLGPDLQVAIASGHSENVTIHQALITIPQVADSDHVYVWGALQARIMDSLSFLHHSPLKSDVAPVAGILQAEGDTEISLQLQIPYDVNAPVGVNVDASLQDAQLTVKPVGLKVDGVSGVLNFTADSISSTRIDARTLGQPIRAKLSSDAAATYLSVQGAASVERVQKQFSYLKTSAVTGNVNYDLKLTLPGAEAQAAQLLIDSDLKGVAVDGLLLEKAAADSKPLNLEFTLDDAPLMPLSIAYGNDWHASLLIDKKRESLHSAHLLFGQGRSAPFQEAGIKLEVRQPRFDLSQALAAFGKQSGQTGLPALKSLALDTAQLLWHERELGPFHFQAQHQDRHWRGKIQGAMADGEFDVPDQNGGDNRIVLEMNQLNLSALEKFDLGEAGDPTQELPLIDIDSRRLLWRGIDLGSLRLRTERRNNGIHFKKIQLQDQQNTLEVSADWLKQANGTVTLVQGSLDSDAFGPFLSRLNFSDDIKETKAHLEFKGGWRGAPHQFSLARLNGQLQLNMKDGRISSIEPGFGRLLGLIAVEQWVKRLSLDFSDVYRQGLAFDEIKGHIKIKDGLAFTDDLQVDAVAAKFQLAGFANLVDKTLDQRVAVVPKSSDAVPIAGTIVSGIAGLITQAVTDDYKEGYFFGSQYQLSGTWGNIEVTPLHDQDGLLKKTWRGLTDFGWLDFSSE
ncbi:YhdP family protein [Methylomonas rhizoryzae]|uniref:YhdP family protein n=1 Tax=Methylomonas rhizoryzae TaxID=2608981 RepID=UPI001231F475|nr:YhdP family protein [Methylomonas rhizoryzae]